MSNKNKQESYSDLYRVIENNFFYMREVMHKIEDSSNQNFYKLNESLLKITAIGIAFTSAIGVYERTQSDSLVSITLLSLSIIAFFLSLLFGIINYYLQQKFWGKKLDDAKKSVAQLNSIQDKMRENRENIPQYYNESLKYQKHLKASSQDKSSDWCTMVQSFLLILGFIIILANYFIQIIFIV